jgi:hypothetical protein
VDDAGLGLKVGDLEAGAVDAEVGDARRLRGEEGHDDGLSCACEGFRSGSVVVVGDVAQRVEEDPGGRAGVAGGGGGHRARHGGGLGGNSVDHGR